jgi:hypothetical protein
MQLTLATVLQLSLVLGIFALGLAKPGTASTELDARRALDKFNQDYITACRKMDNSATAALWRDDGTDLLPGMTPMVGKAKISEWLDGLTPQLAGAKMAYCTVEWQYPDSRRHSLRVGHQSAEDRIPATKEIL